MAVLTVIAMSCPGGASRTIACWPDGVSRPIAVSCPCEASRAIACWPDEVSRPFCFFGRARFIPDCLDSLRPSERNGTEMQVRAALATAEIEVKWSGAGANLASQSSCAGGTVPTIGASGAGSALAPVPDQAQVSAR